MSMTDAELQTLENTGHGDAAEEIRELRSELETERMRLVACGVVARANTPESAAKARNMLPEYRSASCDDVARMVDEQMRLRAELAASREREARMRGIGGAGDRNEPTACESNVWLLRKSRFLSDGHLPARRTR